MAKSTKKNLMDIEQASAGFWWMQEYYTAVWQRWVLNHGCSFIAIYKFHDHPLHDGRETYTVIVHRDGEIVHGDTPGGLAKRAKEEILRGK